VKRYDIAGQGVIIAGVPVTPPENLGRPSGISFAKGIFRE
jgi:hypothetical protein